MVENTFTTLMCMLKVLINRSVSMKENMILKKMKDGQQVVGTFFETIGTSIVECLGIAGLVFLIVDF